MEMELKNVGGSLETLLGFSGKIYFGIPEETNPRNWRALARGKTSGKKGAKAPRINNATLLAILEHGSPVKNIPPRPLLKPVIDKHRNEIERVFLRIYNALINNNLDVADFEMEKLSQRVEMWGKKYFVEENGWAPNAESTIKRKKSDRPLIDTGNLRGSIRGIYKRK